MGTRLKFFNGCRSLWQAVRQLSGDDGYERYLAYHADVHPDTSPLSRNVWFANRQRQKWSGINRCC